MSTRHKTARNYRITAIVLAAGQGSRFGSQKMLHVYNGKTLLSHVISIIDFDQVNSAIIVTGADAAAVKSRHQGSIEQQNETDQYRKLSFVNNPNWQTGMGSSIAAGVTAAININKNEELDAVLIILGDQIHISQQELNHLIKHAKNNQGKIVSAKYNGIIGAPCIFPQSHFEDLTQLTGEQGAKKILNAHSKDILKILINSAANDIDTLKDLT